MSTIPVHDIHHAIDQVEHINSGQKAYLKGIYSGNGDGGGIDHEEFVQISKQLHKDHSDHISEFEAKHVLEKLKPLAPKHHSDWFNM